MLAPRVLGFVFAVSCATASASCFDPVHSDEVDALGPEETGVRVGPTHRPGQPCRVCHGGAGPGKPEFIVAGTVFKARGSGLPSARTDVVFRDSTNTKELRRTRTNEVGNFYLTVDDWKPRPDFPLFVALEDARAEKGGVKEMNTPIGRNGGCAFCHYGADNEPTHMPPIFLRAAP